MKKFSKSGIGFVVVYLIIGTIIWIWPYQCDGGFGIGNFCGLEKLAALFPGVGFLQFSEWFTFGIYTLDPYIVLFPLILIFNLFFYYYFGKIVGFLFEKLNKTSDKIGL